MRFSTKQFQSIYPHILNIENATDDSPEKLDGDSAICIAGASHPHPHPSTGVLTL